jgi:hypothetical protein
MNGNTTPPTCSSTCPHHNGGTSPNCNGSCPHHGQHYRNTSPNGHT